MKNARMYAKKMSEETGKVATIRKLYPSERIAHPRAVYKVVPSVKSVKQVCPTCGK